MADKRGWQGLATDSLSLWLESSSVIAMRVGKLVRGAAGATLETQRMIGEKLLALQELPLKAIAGKLGVSPLSMSRATVSHLRRKVRANRRRLRMRR